MKCPTDGSDLVMAERQGIEIDYCPKCRGVWLDRGELDKIIERSAAAQPASFVPAQPAAGPADYPQQAQVAPQPYDPRYDARGRDPRYNYKKKSFLGEIFDFD